MPNPTRKLFVVDGNFVAPAGVKSVRVTVRQNRFNQVGYCNGGGKFLDRGGSMYAWGSNSAGEVGDNSTSNRSSPVAVVGGVKWRQIGGGSSFCVGVDDDNNPWGFGTNGNNQLGDGSTTSRSSPVVAAGGTKLRDMCGSNTQGVGLRLDGTAIAWGFNGVGSVGDNTITDRPSPVSVVGGHKFVRVHSVSGSSAYGLKADGSLYGWGSNASGQLGDNSTSNRSSPTLVSGGHLFVAVFPSSDAVMALKADGSMYSWGTNSSGQLGHGTTTDRSSPVLIPGGILWAYAGRSGNSFASLISRDGDLYSCGLNSFGQLGDNTTVNKSTPTLVVGGRKYVQVEASSSHTTAMTTAGELYSFGDGSSGRLGDNTTTSKSSPVLVVGTKVGRSDCIGVNVAELVADVVPGTTYAVSVGSGANVTFGGVAVAAIRQASVYVEIEYLA